MTALNISKETFENLYWGEKLSYREVANKLNVKHSVVRQFIKVNNIKTRNKSESIKLSYTSKRRNTAGINNPNYKDGRRVGEKKGQRWRKYGLEKEDFEKMLINQCNKCAICRKDFTTTPSIDHCHNSSKVRGLLCNNCNRAIGLLNDSVDMLERAIKYLKTDF